MHRFFALMALIGGLLHLLCSFTDGMEHLAWVQSTYMALDLMLMLAVVGLWQSQGQRWGLLGQVGFVLAACGLGVISGQNGQLFGVKIYEVGSPVLALGMVLVSLAQLRLRELRELPGGTVGPCLLLASVVTGVASLAVAPTLMVRTAGVLFGLAFMVQARPKTFSGLGHQQATVQAA
jgi:hypothetical protein